MIYDNMDGEFYYFAGRPRVTHSKECEQQCSHAQVESSLDSGGPQLPEPSVPHLCHCRRRVSERTQRYSFVFEAWTMPTTSARLSEFAQEDQQYNGNQFVQTFGGLVYILGLPSAARGRAPSDLVVSRLQYAQWISVYIIQIPSSRGWHGLTGKKSSCHLLIPSSLVLLTPNQQETPLSVNHSQPTL